MLAPTPEQIAGSFKTLGLQLQEANKKIEALESDTSDIPDQIKEIFKRLTALEKKK